MASEAANTGAEARLYARCTSGDQSEIRLGSAVGEHNDRKTDRGRRTPLSLPSLFSSYRPYLSLSLSFRFSSSPFILVPNILLNFDSINGRESNFELFSFFSRKGGGGFIENTVVVSIWLIVF